jgi:hypothetical protein
MLINGDQWWLMVINGINDNNECYHLVMTEAWLSIESQNPWTLMPFVTQLGLVNSECECGKRVPYPRQLFFGICGSLASILAGFQAAKKQPCLLGVFWPKKFRYISAEKNTCWTCADHPKIGGRLDEQVNFPTFCWGQLWPNKNSELAMGYTIWLFNIAMENQHF